MSHVQDECPTGAEVSTKDLEALVFGGLQEGKAAKHGGVVHCSVLPVLAGEEEANEELGQPDQEDKTEKQCLNCILAFPTCPHLDMMCKDVQVMVIQPCA